MRTTICVAALCLVVAACGDSTGGSTTTASETTSTTSTDSSSTAATTTQPVTTTASSTTTTTVPGAFAVDHTGFCVRGTDPTDHLNIRSGPGGDQDIVGTLAFDAIGVGSTGLAAPDAQGRTWFQVEAGGITGWSAGWYLIPEPCTAAVASPAPTTAAGFPDALSGGLVPWPWVDDEWILFQFWPGSGQRYALYLLSPEGDLYEVEEWDDTEIGYFQFLDWRPDGQALLAAADLVPTADLDLVVFDLVDRTRTTIHTAPWGDQLRASFTRPTGRDIVLDVNQAGRERIEVHRGDGSLFSVLVDRPDPGFDEPETTWLYGLGGTTVVVGDGDGLRLLDNHGALIRTLDTPGVNCHPVHWWDDSTVVAGCTPQEVIDAVPISIYSQLWRVPIDGSPATALTLAPDPIPNEVDFGHVDFVRLDGGVYTQWAGDCGAAGRQLVGARDDGIVVFRWTPCWDGPFSLDLASVGGGVIRTLFPDHVNQAIMIRDVP